MTVLSAVTDVVAIVKVALAWPDGTVTDLGTDATEVELLDRLTTTPPDVAGPFRVTVPVEFSPPVTPGGFRPRPISASWAILRVAVFVVEPSVAEIVAVIGLVTEFVVTVKVPVDEPAATVTLAGVCACGLLEPRVTATPPLGAGPLSVTVPIEALPPTTVVGERDRPTKSGGVTVSVAL